MKLRIVTAILALFGLFGPAAADPYDGYFIARQSCPAFQSFRNQTNPGNIMLQEGHSYRIIERNRPDGPSHYRMIVPGVAPPERWVAVECGIRVVEGEGTGGGTAGGNELVVNPVPTTPSSWNLLAASWQPAFCETNGAWTPDNQLKPECATQTPERFDATHFALHGLWPQPFAPSTEYCGFTPSEITRLKARDWPEGAAIVLDDPTRAELATVMPGTQSALEFHEWFKHGTCYGKDQQGYFADALLMMDKLNAADIDEFFVSRLGQSVTNAEIRAEFDRAFGAGAGDRVGIQCTRERDGDRVILTELQLHFKGTVDAAGDLGEMLRASDDLGVATNCSTPMIIDAAGL